MQTTSAQPAEVSRKLSPPRNCVAHAWLTSQVYRELEAEAVRLREHPDRLVAAIVNFVTLNSLIEPILKQLAEVDGSLDHPNLDVAGPPQPQSQTGGPAQKNP